MKQFKTSAKRLCAMLLSVSIVLPLFHTMLGDAGTAQAAVSLVNVEELKQNRIPISILEIVDGTAQGSFGYYIEGQEPCAGWERELAEKSGSEERKSYAKGIFDSLESAGLMGGDAQNYPLSKTADYSELYPWSYDKLSDGQKAEYTRLELEASEKVTVSGSFSYAENGAFLLKSDNISIGKKPSGYEGRDWSAAVQIIDRFQFYSSQPQGTSYYWYDPDFTSVSNTSAVADGTALYTKSGDTYNYAGTVGTAGFSFLSGTSYYTASISSAPTNTRTDENRYAAVSSGFRLAGASEEQSAYFSVQTSQMVFDYVGTGGNASLDESGDRQAQVAVGAVYYKGGYENNDWFWRFVMDWEESEPQPNVTVTSAAASDVTPEQLEAARLIIISYGDYENANDMSRETCDRLLELCTPSSGKALVIDNRLVEPEGASSAVIKEAASKLAAYNAGERVANNIYVAPSMPFMPAAGFKEPLEESKYNINVNANAPYRLVYAAITAENQRRAGSAQELPVLDTKVSVAKTLRHLINGAHISATTKSIRVLSIEPGATRALTEETVKGWLGRDSDAEFDVLITYMSTQELVGSIEDIREEYDLVYIGADISDYKTTVINGETVRDYNDPNMDGLIYTNIGDLVVSGGGSGWNLSGLLDRDYDPASTFYSDDGNRYSSIDTGSSTGWFGGFQVSDTARTFRYSGNDITRKKLEEIKGFADAGFPVVISEKLLASEFTDSGAASSGIAFFSNNDSCTFKTTITYKSAGAITASWENTGFSITDVILSSEGTRVQFLWYRERDGERSCIRASSLTNAATDTLLLTGENAPRNGDIYTCEVAMKRVQIKFLFGLIPLKSYDTKDSSINAVSEKVSYGLTRIDNSSNMYELLEAINDGRSNVMSSNAVNADFINEFLNTAHPVLVFNDKESQLSYPTPYSMDEQGNISSLTKNADSYSMDFDFSISWATDPYMASTRYTARLLLDLNADGLFTDDEQMNGVNIVAAGSSGAPIKSDSLLAGTPYHLSLTLPKDLVGIIPWKLEIYKTGAPAIRCSEQNFTHVSPEEDQKPTINVFQINTSRVEQDYFMFWPWNTTEYGGLNLQSLCESKAGTFYDFLTQVKDFNINIITVKASALDSLATSYKKYVDNPALPVDADDNTALVKHLRAVKTANAEFSCGGLYEILDSFDMLVTGFDDCYQEISAGAAKAIKQYIDNERPVLFSHDNTSFFNLPAMDYQTDRNNYVYDDNNDFFKKFLDWLFDRQHFTAFGYNYNMTVRDAVGLDRYGVTSAATYSDGERSIGITKYSPLDGAGGLVPSKDYLSLSEEQKTALLNAGYSIAYKPNSGRRETVPETQGLTNGILTRYYQSGAYPTKHRYSNDSDGQPVANSITQVNKGQITSYPFDINSAQFGGSADTGGKISISDTHTQYDQLNLNSDDIVVWYCLAGGEFDYMPNDVVNSYYLFSRGNVIYTGFGHSAPEISETETKLLINAIIASYRSFAPQLSFTDSSGLKELESLLIPSDNGELLLPETDTDDPARRLYFKVSQAGSVISSLTLSFTAGEKPLGELPTYSVETDELVSTYKNGEIYYVKLNDIIKALSVKGLEIGNDGLKLTAEIKASANGYEKVGEDSVTLRKLNLFDLS